MKEKVSEAIKTVYKTLEREDLEVVARAVFRGGSKPSDKWSFLNRMIMFSHGTSDARGYRQWQAVGRQVKKGAKAFHILVPIHKKVRVKRKEVEAEIEELKVGCSGCSDKCDGCAIAERIKELEKELYIETEMLVGFKTAAVFAKEDTEGKPLEEDKIKLEIPCEFKALIEELGLRVEPMFYSDRDGLLGYYSPSRNVIRLASPEIETFLHEIAHAVDIRLHPHGSREEREFVAELSAAVIAHLLGYKIALGNVKQYLSAFRPRNLYRALERVERVVSYVVEKTRKDTTVSIQNMTQTTTTALIEVG